MNEENEIIGKKFTLVTRQEEPDKFTADMIEKIKKGEKTMFMKPKPLKPVTSISDLEEAAKEFPSDLPECFENFAAQIMNGEIELPILCVEYDREGVRKYCSNCRFWAGI